VPAGDPRKEQLRELHDLPQFDRLEIEHFFLIYKELEPGKSVEGASWADRAAAEAEVGDLAAPLAGDPPAGLTRMCGVLRGQRCPFAASGLYVKAPIPVTARPTMSVCMVSVPSKVWMASRSTMCRMTW
jgi:Inorganic pyrophosphatase